MRALPILCLLLLATPAAAAGDAAPVSARLIAGSATAMPGGRVLAGIHLITADGWHTYWRNPGDGGAPTTVDWALPAGVTAGPLRWPSPHWIESHGFVSLGYEGSVVLAATLRVPDDWPPAKPLDIAADVTWVACAEICIPGATRLSLRLPATAETAPLEAAAAAWPVPYDGVAAVRRDGDHLRLALDRSLPDGTRLVPETWGHVALDRPQGIARSGSGSVLTLAAGPVDPAGRLRGLLLVPGHPRAERLDVPIPRGD